MLLVNLNLRYQIGTLMENKWCRLYERDIMIIWNK